MLGDGRAILLGEQRAPGGALFDVQLKGAGPTRFSRRGDGLAALGPMLREYLISEAMAGLGIPTTRSLAVVATGEPVYRETIQRGAVLTRVAASHLRVGTFQYALARGNPQLLRKLAEYAIARHFPELVDEPGRDLMFLDRVVERQADLIAQWQLVGFVHGVMNTDNMAISGETIDYGPCAFLDVYHPETVFSSIDQGGRYAYDQQAGIALWNLTRFAETLLPLFDDVIDRVVEQATESLQRFTSRFESVWLAGFRKKLGLVTDSPRDRDLAEQLLAWMAARRADFTTTFRNLANVIVAEGESAAAVPNVGEPDQEWQDWLMQWRQRLQSEGRSVPAIRETMNQANPAVIPRNHRVEEALAAVCNHDDLRPFERLFEAVSQPFQVPKNAHELTEPPPPGCGRYRTFCGT